MNRPCDLFSDCTEGASKAQHVKEQMCVVFLWWCSVGLPCSLLMDKHIPLGFMCDGIQHSTRKCLGGLLLASKHALGGVKKALRGFAAEAPKPYSGPFLGDSVRILGVCPAVTLAHGP